LFSPGDVIIIDFPGVTGIKRRPAVVVSTPIYHAARPDIIVCLITSQTIAIGPTDYDLKDWAQAGLRVPSVFRSFFATLPSATHPLLVGHLSDRDWQGSAGVSKFPWPL
jgi:mRNA interferase MazF